jgi:hypothetical protein
MTHEITYCTYQVFLRWVKRLPKEDIKVILGDNLAAHLSPFVLKMCQQHNIRYLPTVLTYPLYVGMGTGVGMYWYRTIPTVQYNNHRYSVQCTGTVP